MDPSGWTLLMTDWFLSCFGTSPSVILARPHSVNYSLLPAFYSSPLLAWRSLDGSFEVFFVSFRVQRSSCPQSCGGFIFIFSCLMKITLRTLPRVFVNILNVCKFCIWLARNDFRFRSLQPGAIPVIESCLLYTSPSPRDLSTSRMPSSA